ncbi:MAG: hypothetical protein INR64_13875, partial [Caulobacteraceae bacterium]|nr:hypothetical protein [Caulobacter sp.]
GRLDPVGSLAGAAPGFFPALRPLLSQPAFVLTVAATSFGAVVNGAMAAWTPAFFGRVYHLNLKELGLAYGVVKGLTGIAGVLAGGWIAGRSGVGAPPRQLALCAAATLIAAPFFLAFAFAPGVAAGLVALGLFQLFTTMPLGVSYAVVQELAPPSTRALAAAVLALSSTLIGIGGGPLFIGVLTDALHAAHGAAAVKYALVWLVPFMLLGAGVYAAAARAAARRR